jgi:hypothetical protein
MRAFETRYKDCGGIIICANSDAARRVSAMDFAALYGACEISEIAVIDLDLAARHGERHYPVVYDQGVTGFTNVTEQLVGVVTIDLDEYSDVPADVKKAVAEHLFIDRRELKERRARADQAMDRRQEKVQKVARHLCVCIASSTLESKDCTCKSYERAMWSLRNEEFDMKLANAHLDGLVLDR